MYQSDEKYMDRSPGEESGLMIEISSDGEYLRHKELALGNPDVD